MKQLSLSFPGSKVTFNRFANGQGNNHNDGFFFANGGTEDCAVLRRDDGGKWHDYHCESVIGNLGYHFTYICEFRKIVLFLFLQKEFEDTKGVIRIRISKNNRQHNGQMKQFHIPIEK